MDSISATWMRAPGKDSADRVDHRAGADVAGDHLAHLAMHAHEVLAADDRDIE